MNILLCGQFEAGEAQAWAEALRAELPGHQLHTERGRVPDDQWQAAIVANPPPGSLQGLPGLRLIQSLWAGVDRLLADASLPTGVPIARMVDPAMNQAMAETALWATLALHRGFFRYARQQAALQWLPLPQRRADEVPVLVLGGGQMGHSAALALQRQGYPVSLWRRGSPDAAAAVSAPAEAQRTVSAGAGTGAGADAGAAAAGAASAPATAAGLQQALVPPLPAQLARPALRWLAGDAALAAALATTQVLVNLLPLTLQTRGLIDAGLLARLPRGAGLVNLARGAHVVDDDLLAALDAGQLGHAVLDVFHQEPLPADHPFWRHPQVTVLPHAAAATDVRSAAAIAARNISALVQGAPLHNLVARDAGY